MDPLAMNYPWYTPYQFAGNKPIWASDIDGLEELIYQYRLHADKEVSLLRKINNIEINQIRACTTCVPERYSATTTFKNRATGKPASKSDWGTIQYQYLDENEKDLNLHRTEDGTFENGAGENLKMHSNSFPLSGLVSTNPFVYTGQYNPLRKNGDVDYSREPTSLLDAASKQHDIEYTAVNASGAEAAMNDPNTISADIKLIKSAINIIGSSGKGIIDRYTNETISKETVNQAQLVAAAFILLVAKKGGQEAAKQLSKDLESVMELIKQP